MVMHARKVPRLHDGFYEKKSSHLQYEETVNRYSSKAYSSSNLHLNNIDYLEKNRNRKSSPSYESSNSKSQSISPESPSKYVYNKHSYNSLKEYKSRSKYKSRRKDVKSRSRSREKSRDRSLDRKDRSIERYTERYRDKRDRDYYRETKYRERSLERDKRIYYETRDYREKEHRKEKYYSRNECSYAKEKINDKKYYESSNYHKEKEKKYGEWTECVSSSGKKYFYNAKTGVSQWEKPKECFSYEKDLSNLRREDNEKYQKKNLNKIEEYNDYKRIENENSNSSSSNHNQNICKSQKYNNDTFDCDNVYNKNYKWRKEESLNRSNLKSSKLDQSEEIFLSSDKKNLHNQNGECSRIVQNNDNYDNLIDKSNITNSLIKSLNSNELVSPSQNSNLQKIISQFTNIYGLPDLKELPPQEALRTIQQALQLTNQAKKHSSNKNHKTIDSSFNTPVFNNLTESPSSSALTRQQQTALKEHLNQYLKTHQQQNFHSHQNCHQANSSFAYSNVSNQMPNHQSLHSVDGIRHELDNLLVNKINWAQSPNSDCSVNSSTGSRSSSVASNLSMMDTNVSKFNIPTLTPSLNKYFNKELITHVIDWDAEVFEKQANRLSEEAYTIGSLNVTRVSAELKMAHSLVRLTEIQATLQEQRILFIRQQINNVKEWKSQSLPLYST